jgi:hypothetical protein
MIDMNIRFSEFGRLGVDGFSAIVLAIVMCVAVALFLITVGQWKVRMGLLPAFKSLPLAMRLKRSRGR